MSETTVYATDGLARAGGGLGVSLTTTGPGVANALGAFGEAAASGLAKAALQPRTALSFVGCGHLRVITAG